MANLITGEWKKLFQWKFLLILLPLVFLLNGVLLSNQITRDFDENQNIDRWIINEAEPVSYEDFLQGVDEQAEKMQDAAVFNGSYFNRESLEKTRSVYRCLHGIRPETDYPTGMRYVTDYHMTDVFLFLTVIALLIRLMLQERAEGLLHLIKPTKNGRGRLIGAKYLTLVTVVFLLVVLFYGTNYLVAGAMDLLGRGDAAIQSLDGYMASPFAISINTYFYLFLLCKWIAVTAVSSVFFLFCICCRNQVYSILCIVTAFTGELLLWLSIEDYSWLSPIRQLNLAAIMDTSHYFNDYINFNFFGIQISSVTAGLLTVVTAVVVSLLLSVRLFSLEASVEAKKNQWLHPFNRKKSTTKLSASLLQGECKKLFLMQRGLFLLALLLVIQVISYWDSPFFTDKEEAYYQKYSQILEGELSEEKAGWIKTEEERFEALSVKLEEQYQRHEQGEISSAVLEYYVSELTPEQAELNGFKRAKEQYQYLQEQLVKDENVAYLYQTGWNQLLGPEGRQAEVLDFAKLFLILLLALSTLGTIEKTSSVELLIRPSAKGSNAVNRVKFKLCTAYAFAAAAIVFVWRPLQIADYYSLSGIDYSLRSLMIFSQTKWPVSVGLYLGVIYLLKAASAVFAGQLIFCLSRKCRQESTVFFLGGIIFLIPSAAVWFYCGL